MTDWLCSSGQLLPEGPKQTPGSLRLVAHVPSAGSAVGAAGWAPRPTRRGIARTGATFWGSW